MPHWASTAKKRMAAVLVSESDSTEPVPVMELPMAQVETGVVKPAAFVARNR